MERVTLAAASVLVAGLFAGCGLSDPYQHHAAAPATRSSRQTTTAADLGDPPSERGGQIPANAQAAQDHPAAGAGAPTPRAAVERYARLYINWTSAQGLVADQRTLALISIGAARQQAQQAAASASTDTQLTADHVSNTGQVVSATPGAGPAAGKWVIVTSEKTAGERDYSGLPPAVHVTYAKVTHTHQGWVINQWAPQN